MNTRLIIARHGDTFMPNEIPRRVGKTTDLPLIEFEKGKAIGIWLSENSIIPSKIYAAPLKRTRQTAELTLEPLGHNIEIQSDYRFCEIDYGPDENKTEEEVFWRLGNLLSKDGTNDHIILDIGKEVINNWNKKAQVPSGWKVNTNELRATWSSFAKEIEENNQGENILVVTSNGIARFAPILTNDFDKFAAQNLLKISTGAICIFEKSITDNFWSCKEWNLTP